MHLVPFPAHRDPAFHPDSVPGTRAAAFEVLLRQRLEQEFPGESFRLYPDWDRTNTMIIVVPPTVPDGADPRRHLARERRVRAIIDELLRSGAWRDGVDQ